MIVLSPNHCHLRLSSKIQIVLIDIINDKAKFINMDLFLSYVF